jgi:hypothetical protein
LEETPRLVVENEMDQKEFLLEAVPGSPFAATFEGGNEYTDFEPGGSTACR